MSAVTVVLPADDDDEGEDALVMDAVGNHQYDAIRDKWGFKAAETANYGWGSWGEETGTYVVETKVYVEGPDNVLVTRSQYAPSDRSVVLDDEWRTR